MKALPMLVVAAMGLALLADALVLYPRSDDLGQQGPPVHDMVTRRDLDAVISRLDAIASRLDSASTAASGSPPRQQVDVMPADAQIELKQVCARLAAIENLLKQSGNGVEAHALDLQAALQNRSKPDPSTVDAFLAGMGTQEHARD